MRLAVLGCVLITSSVAVAAPQLDTACVYAGACPGLPAISADGTLLAVLRTEEDAGRGNPNGRIEFIEVATQRLAREVLLLTIDEYDGPDPDALVTGRISSIDLRGFRALARLDERTQPSARVDGSIIRIRDRARGTRFRADYEARSAAQHPDPDRAAGCSSLNQYGDIPAWWDADTRTIVTSVRYTFGGCLCGSKTDLHVERLP